MLCSTLAHRKCSDENYFLIKWAYQKGLLGICFKILKVKRAFVPMSQKHLVSTTCIVYRPLSYRQVRRGSFLQIVHSELVIFPEVHTFNRVIKWDVHTYVRPLYAFFGIFVI
jgi:hypothetical protein